MLEWITQINNAVNGVVWGPAGLALLFGTGLIMSVRTGFFQFRKMGYWLRHTIGAIFTNKDVTAHTSKEDMAISQFQSMCTALAGTIGTGNIVGVATAIVSGGPGAIFWMWVMALLGMMTSFSENVLGVYYRRKNEKGEWSGGAMYYLTDGLGAKKGCKQLGKVLAVLFACFCILASFGIGNMSQLNSIAGNMNAAFGVPTIVTGLALMVVTALIVIGGLKRVAAVTEKLVPLMALFYIAGALIIVVMHAGNIPAAFGAIFKGAFNLQAAGGGALGYGISQTITWGFKRGAFSNEAGLGSAVMVNSASNVKEPVHQGMWGVFEVFADTIVVCTLTALVILTTGVVDLQSGAVLANVQDNALVGQAFTAAFGSLGPKFIAISILLFAYSTTLGWSHYGTKAVEYLFGTTGSETSLQIDPGLIRCQTCVSAYISTAFLCGGTVTDPQKEYNLEFLTGRTNLAKDFEALLAEHEFAPHRTRRNGVNLIYVKSSASVERILAFMGAAEASAQMNAQKAVKQLRNQINRQTNCDTANLGKTARANAQTTRAIRFLQEQGALETLPEVLQQAAAMRMENPDLSLTALCACFDPPVSKSGLSHRMKKLEALAEDLRRRLEENAEKEETK